MNKISKDFKDFKAFRVGRRGLKLADFQELGEFAAAGLEAATLALERADESLASGRIPISGAAVELTETKKLHIVTVGHNGRIPEASSEELGYPTDHGETGALRQIKDVSKINWSRVVFATSLSPCVMCGSALTWLWELGLRRVVVAESTSFGGTASLLAKLEGMTVVSLSNVQAQLMMRRFSRRYPWDWAADIGEVPPQDLSLGKSLECSEFLSDLVGKVRLAQEAVVLGAKGPLSSAQDERPQSGGNETRSAVMLAMGRAGSHVNLRECAILYRSSKDTTSLADFGPVSVGACKLFRPCRIILTAPPTADLSSSLEDARIPILLV